MLNSTNTKENLIGASTPRILLPVTLALDIVTSPLQLLMIPILSASSIDKIIDYQTLNILV